LQHPHIVQIYEVGEQQGRPYFSLEFVEGGSLAQKLAGTPLPARQAAQLVETVARGVHAAHERRIIHRDLKPANVLLTADGTPKITDFGLAKRVDAGPGLTESGVIVGTPSYMAPEQAGGNSKEIGPACDVYALGANLYELLTGRPPFKAATAWDTVLQVLHKEPVSPRLLNPTIYRDLETICLKCLAKEPARRFYRSARELAEDLRRFLNGEPIHARPVGQAERLWRWWQRNRAVAGLLAAVILSLVLGTVVASFFALRSNAYAQRAFEKALEAEENARLASENEQHALGQKRDADASRTLAEKEKQRAEEQRERAERHVYYGQIALAQREWQDNEVAHARALLDACRLDLRGWEHAYLRRLCDSNQQTLQGHTDDVNSVAFSPDGKRIVSGSVGTTLETTLKVWDTQTGQETLTIQGHAGPVYCVAFNPDGTAIVSAGVGMVKLWDAQTGQETLTLQGHTDDVNSVAFSPDGKRIVSGGGRYDREGKPFAELKLWDVQTGQETRTLKGHTHYVLSVAFSPDGKWIVSGSMDTTLKVWDAQTGEPTLLLSGHTGPVHSVAFSPDGRRILSGGGELKVWDAQTGQEIRTLKGHTGWVHSVAFSPDGTRIVSGSNDRTLKLWDAETGQETRTLQGHASVVYSVAFSPVGKRIMSASGDRTLKVWDVQTGQEILTLKGHTAPVHSVAFSPDGKRIVSGSLDKTIKLWDARAGQETFTLKGHT
jgi:WD40 repeat protein